MKIALIGYGNMGQEIENVVKEQKKHEIISISYKKSARKLDTQGIAKSDVAIEFTSPEVVLHNITEVAKLKIPMVIGTTGWYVQIDEVKRIIKQEKIGLIYGQNFSIGANIFFQLTALAGKLTSKYGSYDVSGVEMHHTGKKDSPSGTARKLSQIIMQNFPKKTQLQSDRLNRKITEQELHFASVRIGRNPGRHEIIFDSSADEIRLTHSAWNRRGFAEGAILAAEFIRGKKGVYSFDNVFEETKV